MKSLPAARVFPAIDLLRLLATRPDFAELIRQDKGAFSLINIRKAQY